MAQRGVDFLAVGVALTATLITTFVVCNIAAYLLSSAHFPKCWVCLFTDAEPGSHKSMSDGILVSGLFGIGFFYRASRCLSLSGKTGALVS